MLIVSEAIYGVPHISKCYTKRGFRVTVPPERPRIATRGGIALNRRGGGGRPEGTPERPRRRCGATCATTNGRVHCPPTHPSSAKRGLDVCSRRECRIAVRGGGYGIIDFVAIDRQADDHARSNIPGYIFF